MRGYLNPGLRGVNPGLRGVNPGLWGVNPGLLGANPGLLGVNPGLRGVNPGLRGVNSPDYQGCDRGGPFRRYGLAPSGSSPHTPSASRRLAASRPPRSRPPSPTPEGGPEGVWRGMGGAGGGLEPIRIALSSRRASATIASACESANNWGRKLNSPVVERLNKGLTANFHLGHFFGVRKKLGGELRNFPVVERLNKGLTAACSPSGQAPGSGACSRPAPWRRARPLQTPHPRAAARASCPPVVTSASTCGHILTRKQPSASPKSVQTKVGQYSMANEDFLPYNFTVSLPYLHCNYRILPVFLPYVHRIYRIFRRTGGNNKNLKNQNPKKP
eukprot:1184499-Prorocentrum_minimum.AAC.4